VSLTIAGALFFPYLAERLSIDSEISDKCPPAANGTPTCPPGTPTNELVAKNNANIARADDIRAPLIVTSVLGALLVGGGIYLLATSPSGSAETTSPPPSTVRVRVVPNVSARDQGLSILGTF
jgi:hypothetical protein